MADITISQHSAKRQVKVPDSNARFPKAFGDRPPELNPGVIAVYRDSRGPNASTRPSSLLLQQQCPVEPARSLR
jgi:hypothetical protein